MAKLKSNRTLTRPFTDLDVLRDLKLFEKEMAKKLKQRLKEQKKLGEAESAPEENVKGDELFRGMVFTVFKKQKKNCQVYFKNCEGKDDFIKQLVRLIHGPTYPKDISEKIAAEIYKQISQIVREQQL